MNYYKYNVKNPFMCRENQFGDGVRNLCVGISLLVALNNEGIEINLGKNEKTIYRISKDKILEVYNKFGAWKSTSGAETVILPVKYFEVVKTI